MCRPMPEGLADLLNPAINKGTTGMGSHGPFFVIPGGGASEPESRKQTLSKHLDLGPARVRA